MFSAKPRLSLLIGWEATDLNDKRRAVRFLDNFSSGKRKTQWREVYRSGGLPALTKWYTEASKKVLGKESTNFDFLLEYDYMVKKGLLDEDMEVKEKRPKGQSKLKASRLKNIALARATRHGGKRPKDS